MLSGVTAVIISFNGGDQPGACAESLSRQVDRIVIVDNGSDEVSRSRLRDAAADKDWEIVWLAKNLGIAAALNIGLKIALERGSPWMLTMDQDSLAAPDMMCAFSNLVAHEPAVACASPALPGINPRGGGSTMRYAITSGNLVKTKVAEEVGGYWDDLFIDGVDLDFSLRLKDAGHLIYRAPGAHIRHRLGDRASSIPFHSYHSPVRRYYIFRNYWALMARHARGHPGFAIRLTVAHIFQFATILLFGAQRRRSLSLIARGIGDAMRGRMGVLRAP